MTNIYPQSSQLEGAKKVELGPISFDEFVTLTTKATNQFRSGKNLRDELVDLIRRVNAYEQQLFDAERLTEGKDDPAKDAPTILVRVMGDGTAQAPTDYNG